LSLHQTCKTKDHIWCNSLEPHFSSIRHFMVGPS
jgi:hypothetical protein